MQNQYKKSQRQITPPFKTTKREPTPFAITAECIGHPRKLHTPITIININTADQMVATRCNAMWDTGSEMCIMSRRLAEALEIDFVKAIPAIGLTGDAMTPCGYTNVALVANDETIEVMTAIVDETSPSGEYSFIIGLSLISKGTLAITSTRLTTTLSFVVPSPEPIDFTRLGRLINGPSEHLPLSAASEHFDILRDAEAASLISPDLSKYFHNR